MSEPHTAEASLPRTARIGRWIAVLGFLGLAAAFFMPHEINFTPVRSTQIDDPPDNMRLFPFYYAFAMLLFLLLTSLRRTPRVERRLGHWACAMTLLLFVLEDVSLAWVMTSGPWPRASNEWAVWLSWVASAGGGTILVPAAWIRGPVRARFGACAAIAAFSFTGTFLLFMVGGPAPLFGAWISLVSSGLIACGALVELLAPWDAPVEDAP